MVWQLANIFFEIGKFHLLVTKTYSGGKSDFYYMCFDSLKASFHPIHMPHSTLNIKIILQEMKPLKNYSHLQVGSVVWRGMMKVLQFFRPIHCEYFVARVVLLVQWSFVQF